MRSAILVFLGAIALAICSVPAADTAKADKRLKLLFLGDKGHHAPSDRFRQLAPVMKKRGIDLSYTEALTDLNDKTLSGYDGLVVYANQTKISDDQERALLDYVASGKGFVPLHCASYCFLNSQKYIDLVGAQFRSHGAGVFRTTLADVKHPILTGYAPFSSWDETYLHTKHNEKDRIVLEYRIDGKVKEPWTWVRTHGKGRVFYTAWGHDARTWGHAGFTNLVERGIRWACGDDPAKAGSVFVPNDSPTMTKIAKDLPAFEYVEAKIPFYPGGTKWGTQAKPLTKMQKPVGPEESMKHMSTPEDFEVKLFASEKLLGGKPLCMNWDERGRLWVAITMDYPNELQPAGKGRDKIVILEDTDHDGVADKVTTFADKLSIPTSMVFYKGGLIVAQAPHMLYLTEKDGKEAERKILFSGWSTGDTHAGPSNLWYGHDNWIHGIVGYAGFKGTVGGERHSFRQGFYRFKPDGSKLEFLRSTNNNSWGVGFSEEGLHFGSTANGNPSVYLPIPNRYYENVRGWSSSLVPSMAGNEKMSPITEKVRQVDWHGHFTAASGHSLYTARAYPRDYWNRTAFVTEPTGHLVATFTLHRDGANVTSRNSWNLLASADEWVAPIQAEVGPDGHVWVIDWYNYIVQHNPTPAGFKTGKGAAYETELRDKKHGRIYRIVYKKAPKYTPIDLGSGDTEKRGGMEKYKKTLIETLKHDNMRWRLHAQRLLVERSIGFDARQDLIKLSEDKSVDEIGLNVGAIHALWALDGRNDWRDRALSALVACENALKHPSAGVRRTAALVSPRASGNPIAREVLRDKDSQVRLAAMLSLASARHDYSVAKALADLLKDDEVMNDRWLSDGLTAAAAAHDSSFLSQLPNGLSLRGRTIVNIVARHYTMGTPDKIDDILSSLAALKDSATIDSALSGLAEGWKTGQKASLKDETEAALVKRLPTLSATGKASLIKLMNALGSKAVQKHAAAVVKSLLETVEKTDAPDAERAEAARQVVEMLPDDLAIAKQLLDSVSFQTPPEVTAGILDAVGASTSKDAAAEVLKRLGPWTPATKTRAIRVLLGRPSSTTALLDAIDKGSVKLSDLALDHKQALAAHPNKSISERAKKLLAKSGDLPNADRQKVIEALLPLLKKSGDVAKGKAVFEAQCAKCHKHTAVTKGEDIGPDLTGMAVHPKEELLIHIMDPSRSVEGNFRIYTVTTKGGQVFTGMLASETKTTLELVDSEAKRTTIQRAKIDTLEQSEKSLMPDGFEKQVKEPELVDLLEFLTQKGKYLPLPLDKAATVVSTKNLFFDTDSTIERLVFRDWKPKTVGEVPFVLVDPRGTRVNNVILLNGPEGQVAPKMPKSVSVPCNTSAKAIHLLGGIAGWGYPAARKGTVSMIVRLHYKDGKTEDHELLNGEHIADYIRKVDVPGSKHAFDVGGKQVRYLSLKPKREEVIAKIEFVKGTDRTAPVVVAVTVEPR